MTKANEKANEEEENEPKIPVFTVLKNGAILKNIFIVNKPPPPPHSKPISAVHQQQQTTQEEILIVGRHPDCNIVLTHPSISRFHLQILSNPSSQTLSLTDLSSVHGTWVSDKRIEAGVRVELREVDTLRVGGSSRVYSLHWIPLSRAYNYETPSVPLTKHEEEEEEHAEEQVDQGESFVSIENKETESPDSNSVSDENLGLIGKKVIPSAPPISENGINSIFDESEEGGDSLSEGIGEKNDFSSFWAFGTESVNLFMNTEEANPSPNANQCRQYHCITEEVSERENSESYVITEKEGEACRTVQVPEETENLSPLRDGHGKKDISCLSTSPLVIGELLGEIGNQQVEDVNPAPEPEENFVNLKFENYDEKEVEAYHSAQVPEESQYQSPLRTDHGKIDISCLSSGPLVMENLLIGKVLGENKDEQVEEESPTLEIKSNLLVNLNFEDSDEKGVEAYPSAQVPEKSDDGQTDTSCLSSAGPPVMENLMTGEVLGEDRDEQFEEESLTSEPKSNLLVNLNFEDSDEKDMEAYPATQVPGKSENQGLLRNDDGQTDISSLSSGPLVMGNLSLPTGEGLGEDKDQQVTEESLTPEPGSNLLVNQNFEHSDETEFLLDERLGETENKSVSPEYNERRDATSNCSAPLTTESINLSLPDGILSELIDDKESQTPQSLFTAAGQPGLEFCESPPLRSENNKSSLTGNIWARRGKPASAVQIQTDRSRGKTTEAGYDDDSEQEEEMFTPDKENFTPNTLRLRSLIKKGKIEVKHSKSDILSSLKLQDVIVSPEKQNKNFEELQERKSVGMTFGNQARVEKKLTATKVRRERMPFQSLKSSGGKNRSEDLLPNTATRSSASVTYTQKSEKVTNRLCKKSPGERKRGWTMVADTTTLLDKESRKSLQLLQGLMGTHLIIPRMVIRELDCLKQRSSLFRKKTEACLVLEWIEECMIKTNWWIHVQSSMEDGRLTAPTPPASPQSLSSEKSWGFPSETTSVSLPFSRCTSSLMDLVSPAAEDHILDCALLRRKMKNDGQLVLLSNDITLKIKAMAEGLLCETAKEFRESLVNPSSERFMWPDSSPRGHTWSYVADVVLQEKYNSCPLKKPSKGEGAKGLKLILLHNSHYGQIR